MISSRRKSDNQAADAPHKPDGATIFAGQRVGFAESMDAQQGSQKCGSGQQRGQMQIERRLEQGIHV